MALRDSYARRVFHQAKALTGAAFARECLVDTRPLSFVDGIVYPADASICRILMYSARCRCGGLGVPDNLSKAFHSRCSGFAAVG